MVRIFAVLACLMLAACMKAQDTASQGLDAMGTSTENTYNKTRDLFDLGKKKPPPEPKVQPRYCYKTLEDVICYGRPLPGQEERLTAFQDAKGHTGYVIEPPVVTEIVVHKKPVPSPTPTPTPVVGASPKSKEGDGKQLKEIIFDPAELQPKELVPDKAQ